MAASAVLALAACSGGVELPPTDGVLDYQLGGAYDELPADAGAGSGGIDVVVRDATAPPLEGAYNVCYVNGFQTQPGEADAWLARDELLLRDGDGSPVVDPDWPDEYVLDPSSAAQREGILQLVAPLIAGCAEAGFDAVEIDNLDTWTRFDGLSQEGAEALARAYVEHAHELGLAIAQKNAVEVAQVARDEWGFDFAVVEECAVWDECGAYREVYGDYVLQVEYADALAETGMAFGDVCSMPDRSPLTVLRDRDLVAAGEPGYVYEAC
ncbi:endo alpha-1,4 polygalactosaminidase [Demequina activiva]|uniref:endo alpha-1,4 polygalactosaminidase n=1 Tax=Demequina activiva TaxID=1582364 RepID=UPI001EF3AF2A|nr:endo alpha-1,4 polygalactosaminidase [Demequina activiva]